MVCRVSRDFSHCARMIVFNTMKLQNRLPLSLALTLLLGSCANNNDPMDPHGTGPFDDQGNYVENWADDPAKWRRPGSRQKPKDDLPVIAANERPPENASPLPPARPTTTRPTITAKPNPNAIKPTRPVVATPKPKPKPKPKPQPSYVRYTVKKGDTLGAIAARNGSTVSGIQRASGISGTLIRPGQVLKVPKKR
jgi:LysM repeat protein